MAPDDQQPGEERSPWSKPSVLLSGMFLLALLLAGIALVILKSGSSTPRAQVTVGRTTTSSAASASASSTACTLPAGSQSVPYNSPPAGTQWGTVGSMSVPQASGTLGPQHTSGVWNTCFAHSPTGALLAAMNFWAESTHGAADAGETYQHLAVNVPRGALSATDHLDDTGPFQYDGYKYDSYTSSEARISLVMRGPGKLIAVVTPMSWNGSDWRYLFPSGGVPPFEAIPDLTGYVPWSEF